MTMSMEDISKKLSALEARVATLEGSRPDDADLDGPYGDPDVRRDPSEKYWTGASLVGRKFSACPTDYLHAMARWLEARAYMTEKEGDPQKQKYVAYQRKDAARARGWAKRNEGKVAPVQQTGFGDDDDSIPF